MARRTKPCEFCAEETFGAPDVLRNAEVYLEVYPDVGHIAFTVFSKSDDGEVNGEAQYSLPMEYCPNCGRKLV